MIGLLVMIRFHQGAWLFVLSRLLLKAQVQTDERFGLQWDQALVEGNDPRSCLTQDNVAEFRQKMKAELQALQQTQPWLGAKPPSPTKAKSKIIFL